jgi:fructokinase
LNAQVDKTLHTAGRAITVVGEALIDLVPTDRGGLFEATPGGSPANVALGLARLNVPVQFVGRIAEDAFGRRLRAHLSNNGVDLSMAVRAQEASSLAIVQVNAQGGVEYDFRVENTADWQWTDTELAPLARHDAAALHAGSLAAALLPGAEAIERLMRRARASATISFDPNCRPALMCPHDRVVERIERLVSLADVVKASAEDLAWLAPGREPSEVAADWLRRGPALVVVTLGADGVLAAIHSSGSVYRAGRTVSVVDTVGAGDAFVSALLAGLYQRELLGAKRRDALRTIDERALVDVLDLAVLASALTCARRGADPPTSAELAAALATA